jgi:hypothetical protein
MQVRLQLDWDNRKLLELCREAQRSVEHERIGIAVVAGLLLRHRHLNAADLRCLVPCSVC